MASPNFVMRTVLISPEIDMKLRALAFKQNKSKNDLIRGFLEDGLGSLTATKKAMVNKRFLRKAGAKAKTKKPAATQRAAAQG